MPTIQHIPELEDQYSVYCDQESENVQTLGFNPDGCYFCGMHSHTSDACPHEYNEPTEQ